MTFSEIISHLKQGACLSRTSWSDSFITRQVPQTIVPTVVPNMTSLSPLAKDIITKAGPKDASGFLAYDNQVLIVKTSQTEVTKATSYFPTWEDIFADDWYLL